MASRDKQLRILEKKSVIALQKESARRKELEIIQINLGTRCNQHCATAIFPDRPEALA